MGTRDTGWESQVWEGLGQHRGVGRDDRRGEEGWCELVWFFHKLGQRCKVERGGKGVADSSTPGPPCPHLLPLPTWGDGADPCLQYGQVLARSPWPARGHVLLSALQPPVSRWMGRNLLSGL